MSQGAEQGKKRGLGGRLQPPGRVAAWCKVSMMCPGWENGGLRNSSGGRVGEGPAKAK